MSAYFVETSTITAMLAAGLGHTQPGLIGNANTTPLTWWTTSMSRIREQLAGGDRYDQFRRKLDFGTVDEVGRMLLAENARSMEARYHLSERDDEHQREAAGYQQQVRDYVYPDKAWVYALTATDVVGCITCFEYQACEHPEWEESEAHSFCQNLSYRILIGLCPNRPWGLDHAELEAKRTGAQVLSAMFLR